VILRYDWSRTYGYLMLRSTGSPRRIGDRFRLDTLITWEQAVLAGVLSGRPDELATPAATAASPAATDPEPEPTPPVSSAGPVGDEDVRPDREVARRHPGAGSCVVRSGAAREGARDDLAGR
jgi:hypothetical protein